MTKLAAIMLGVALLSVPVFAGAQGSQTKVKKKTKKRKTSTASTIATNPK